MTSIRKTQTWEHMPDFALAGFVRIKPKRVYSLRQFGEHSIAILKCIHIAKKQSLLANSQKENFLSLYKLNWAQQKLVADWKILSEMLDRPIDYRRNLSI